MSKKEENYLPPLRKPYLPAVMGNAMAFYENVNALFDFLYQHTLGDVYLGVDLVTYTGCMREDYDKLQVNDINWEYLDHLVPEFFETYAQLIKDYQVIANISKGCYQRLDEAGKAHLLELKVHLDTSIVALAYRALHVRVGM